MAGLAQSDSLLPFREGDLEAAFQARRDSLINYYQQKVNPEDLSLGEDVGALGMHDPARRVNPDLSTGGYPEIAANLYRGTYLDWSVARLDSLMANPQGDMFWMFPFTTVMYVGADVLPEDTRAKMRDLWRTYTPYRGDTENHWAMYHATLYLAAQMYPGEPGETWFTGKSSEENMAEAEEYLLSWMELTTTKGQGEYDSPHYLNVYVAPMALLYAFAEDPAMRLRAEMMLDYLLADMAAESLQGLGGGAHSRIYEREVIQPWQAAGAPRMSWLLFGNTPFAPSRESLILALSGYSPTPLLHGIATDRREPYVHRELKRTRHRFRYSDVKNARVYKYTYVDPDYVIGSSQGGLLQPIQQQTWSLIWWADDPRTERNTLFSLHPYSSPEELGMYFAELQEFVTELVVRSKTEYDSPDKLTGGSPFEQVVQEKDALVALYSIEPGTRFEQINAFFSSDLSELDEDASGWIFARGGDALIAYYPLAPYHWEEQEDHWDSTLVHRRLVSPHLQNGAVVQVAPASEYDSFDAFEEAVRALPLEAATDPVPRVAFTSLRGDRIEMTYGDVPIINGDEVDYDHWPLFEGPFLEAAEGSGTLSMRYGPWQRTLDFNTLTREDTVETSSDTTTPGP